MQDVINTAGRGDMICRMHFSSLSPRFLAPAPLSDNFPNPGDRHSDPSMLHFIFFPLECLLHSHCVSARLPLGFERARPYSDASALPLVKQRHPVSQPGVGNPASRPAISASSSCFQTSANPQIRSITFY